MMKLMGFAILFGISTQISAMEIMSSPSSSIKIDGDSSVRKYSATAKPVAVKGIATAGTAASTLPWNPQEVELALPVVDLSSGERTLDKHMRENLKADQYPQILLKLTHFELAGGAASKTNTVKTSGTMTVAGVTKPIELESAVSVEQQKITIQGKKRILMSDFGIKPPVLMMGTLKTRDEIDVSYSVELLPNPVQKKASP
jgi:polyisoprenoid-binding protein YceI